MEHSESAREPLEAAARKLETRFLERLEVIERTVASVDTSSQLTREQLIEDSRSVAESAQAALSSVDAAARVLETRLELLAECSPVRVQSRDPENSPASLSSVDVVAMHAVTSEALALAVPCHHCLGTGKYGWSPCHFCHGCVDGYMGRDGVVGMVGIEVASGCIPAKKPHGWYLTQMRALLASRGGDGTQDGAG